MIVKRVFKKVKEISFVIILLLGLLTSNLITAQNKKVVSGVVKDETGVPVAGVNIVEKGTKNSASTDFDGKFSINVAEDKAILTFSFIGFDTKAVNVAGSKVLNVSLQSTTSKLNEVVVVGYGTSKK